MNRKQLLTPLVALASVIGGASLGLAGMAAAQTTAPATSTGTATVQTDRPQGHAPLGNDGVINAIQGATITMAEEADEGGASYTVDASSATVTKAGTAATRADLKV